MASYPPRSSLARTTTLVVVLAATISLAACSSTTGGASTPSPHASTASGHTPTPAATVPAAGVGATPVTLSCDTVLTPSQLYSFNPNFVTNPSYTPTSGSLPSTIVSDKGVSCGWLNESSGDKLEVAIAELPTAQLTTLKNAAIGNSNPVPTYGVPPQVEGYFTMRGNTGEVQAFTGNYWVVSLSTAYQEPGDAAPVMQSVLQNLASN